MAKSFPIPIKGVHKGVPYAAMAEDYSPDMNNVRVRDVLDTRLRLGKRPGQKKWSTTLVGGSTQPVVAICVVHSVS